jgi:hypothetical protein
MVLLTAKDTFRKISVLAFWYGRMQAEHLGIIGVYYKVGKGNTGGRQEAKRACFSSSGALRTHANLGEGRNQVIPIQ